MAGTAIPVARMQTQSREINQLQSNIINAFAALSNELLNTPSGGQFILSQKLKSGNNQIQHGLGVLPIGYLIISQDAVASFYLVSSTTNLLTLNSSADVEASLFVF